GGADVGDVVGLDAAGDFQVDGLPAPGLPAVDAGAGLGELVQGVRNERLAAEPRVDRHQQDQVESFHDVVQPFQRRGRVEHQAGAAAVVADQGQRAVDMARGFGVEADDVRAGLGEGGHERVDGLDHQVHVDGRGEIGRAHV